MADLTINIPAPSITAGQYFKVRYRQLPSGGWSSYTNQSNAPFTITGLSVADYEFEFIFVNEEGTQCPATYRTYTVTGDYDCISTFNAVMKKVNNLTHIEVTYTLPPAHTDPACGWEIEYILNGNSQKFTMNALPAGGLIKIPCPNEAGVIYIRALMCNGRMKECYSMDIEHFPDPPCVPMNNVQMSINQVTINGRCEYFLDITYQQSSPATQQVQLHYNQVVNGLPAGDNFSGTVALSSGATSFRKILNPHFNEGDDFGEYYISFIDRCGHGPATLIPIVRMGCFEKRP